MFINYITLFTALVLSGVSGYFSVIGLTTLFAGSFWSIVIMGSALEVSKLVTASWLYRNWKRAAFLLKVYLCIAVFVLVLITSMGVFGFLSRAHIDQQLKLQTGTQDQISIVDQKIEFVQQNINDLDGQIAQIDTAIKKYVDLGQVTKSLKAVNEQKQAREELMVKKQSKIDEISTLKQEKIQYTSEQKKQEAEVGPLKYVAEMIYGQENAESHFDAAVRMVILTLVVVFDPLAVLLLIAANSSLKRKDEEPVVQPTPVVQQDIPEQPPVQKARKPNVRKNAKKRLTKKTKENTIVTENLDSTNDGGDWLASSVRVSPNDILKM